MFAGGIAESRRGGAPKGWCPPQSGACAEGGSMDAHAHHGRLPNISAPDPSCPRLSTALVSAHPDYQHHQYSTATAHCSTAVGPLQSTVPPSPFTTTHLTHSQGEVSTLHSSHCLSSSLSSLHSSLSPPSFSPLLFPKALLHVLTISLAPCVGSSIGSSLLPGRLSAVDSLGWVALWMSPLPRSLLCQPPLSLLSFLPG